jgi:hypothetical protein
MVVVVVVVVVVVLVSSPMLLAYGNLRGGHVPSSKAGQP